MEYGRRSALFALSSAKFNVLELQGRQNKYALNKAKLRVVELQDYIEMWNDVTEKQMEREEERGEEEGRC